MLLPKPVGNAYLVAPPPLCLGHHCARRGEGWGRTVDRGEGREKRKRDRGEEGANGKGVIGKKIVREERARR